VARVAFLKSLNPVGDLLTWDSRSNASCECSSELEGVSKARSSDVDALKLTLSSGSCSDSVVRRLRGELTDPSTINGPLRCFDCSTSCSFPSEGLEADPGSDCWPLEATGTAVCRGGVCAVPAGRVIVGARRGDKPPFCIASPTWEGIGDMAVL
jgi:hypothetical protein